MKHWLNGIIWRGIEVTANPQGVMKYWNEGTPHVDVFPTSAAPPAVFVPRVMWFT